MGMGALDSWRIQHKGHVREHLEDKDVSGMEQGCWFKQSKAFLYHLVSTLQRIKTFSQLFEWGVVNSAL